MITVEKILNIDRKDLQKEVMTLDRDDIRQLVEWLSVKNDELRYRAFLLLEGRSAEYNDVFPYWDIFRGKLKSEISYQRSIGAMLIADNARWDTGNRMADALDDYLGLLKDEKPITVRQCIQALGKIAASKPELSEKITEKLISINLLEVKETMRKSILLDILNVLANTANKKKSDDVDTYIANALTGEMLDKKTKKQVVALFFR